MANSLPKTVPPTISLAAIMNNGLVVYGMILHITQVLPAAFAALLTSLIDTEAAFNAARTAKQVASDVFKPADVALSEWLQVTRNVLAARFGNRWSNMWAQAGFTNATTSVPKRIGERFALAAALAVFFRSNPDYEVASLDVTQTQATALRNAAMAAQDALLAADVVLKDSGTARDAALAAMLETMRKLVSILHASLLPTDTRWLSFGLKMPAMNTTPGQPQNLRLMLGEDGELMVECDPVALAQRYRFRMLVVGVETEYRLAARSTEPMGKITGVEAGQRVQVIVQAVNGTSQGVASEAVIFTMPALEEPNTKAETATLPATSGARNGTNGHANGSRSLTPDS